MPEVKAAPLILLAVNNNSEDFADLIVKKKNTLLLFS